MNEIKLDKIDTKLLCFIFDNFRLPLTVIAKKCQISREQVEYRIKKYEEIGLIKNYYTMFNLSVLGYNKNYIVKLRVKNPKSEKLSQINNIEDVLIISKLQSIGNWDYIITVFTKEKTSILDFISTVYELWKTDLLDYEIFEPIELHFFPMRVFRSKKEDKIITLHEEEKMIIDKLDEKIIEIIANDAKIKIIELADKIKEKPETVNYRLKKLVQSNIIIGYRLFLNLNLIGYKLAQLVVKLNNISKLNIKKITNYAKSQEKIHGLSIGIGKFNVIFQIIYKTPSELSEEINKIKENFSENILEYELIHIENELTPKTI